MKLAPALVLETECDWVFWNWNTSGAGTDGIFLAKKGFNG